MITRRLDARSRARRGPTGSSLTAGRVTIVLCQHTLLCTALYIAASTMYTLIVGAISVKDIPSVILLLASSIVSIFYVALHNISTKLHTSARNMTQCERADTFRSLTVFTLRILATFWLISAALSITITTSRQPLCVLSLKSSNLSKAMTLDKGMTCVLNRAAILSSFVALLASGLMFILVDRVKGPFRCHLLGVVEEHRLLPLFLPYHKTANLAMRSEMSFKCRSSTSVESDALEPQRSRSARLDLAPRKVSAKLLPPNPRNTLGLGIYTSKTSLPPSIITPWPSVSTVRSHASTYPEPPPPESPLPPLPAYVPCRHHSPKSPQRATYPPQRPARPVRTRSFMTAPIKKPHPALMKLHLAALSRNDSLSSVYSRSTISESLPALSESGRTLNSSSSTSTLGGSSLKAMSVVPESGCSATIEGVSSWEVDNVDKLQAKISPMRHSAKIGVMHRRVKDTRVESPSLPIRAKSVSPRKIRKTRESGREHSMF